MEMIGKQRFLQTISVLLKNIKDENKLSKTLSQYFDAPIECFRYNETEELISLLEYCLNTNNGVISYMLFDLNWINYNIKQNHDNVEVNGIPCKNWNDFYNILSDSAGVIHTILKDGLLYDFDNHIWYF